MFSFQWDIHELGWRKATLIMKRQGRKDDTHNGGEVLIRYKGWVTDRIVIQCLYDF